MSAPVWSKALEAAADPARARHHFELLAATEAGPWLAAATAEQARVLAAVFSGSEALTMQLAAHPDWVELLALERLQTARSVGGLEAELTAGLRPRLAAGDFAGALAAVRLFKQRQLLRIAARDLARLAPLPEILRELSDVADVCLSAVWRVCHQQLVGRHGRPCHRDAGGRWQPTPGCVLGLGKLGGQELNYSSDVDLLFVYAEEGDVLAEPPRGGATRPAGLSNHQFFQRLVEAFVGEVSRLTPEGTLYRVDLRLRPEGEAGPLARSLASYENYYAQWGQTWERMMLLKARCVAGDAALAAEFLETIQPFRYPRSVSEDVLEEVAAMKTRIEQEIVKPGELERNVKLGRGGIREIEFLVQAHQLLRGGRQPFLQQHQTLAALDKLAQYEVLTAAEAAQLRAAYGFLREVEHRLQMEGNRQTHSLPTAPAALRRLAALMGEPSPAAFEAVRRRHTANVRRIYDKFLKSGRPASPSPFPAEFSGQQESWRQLLGRLGFRQPDAAVRLLQEFVEGPGYVHVSARTSALARKLLARLLALCPGGRAALTPPPAAPGLFPRDLPVLSDPDRVVTRLDGFLTAYGARAMLFETWNSNPALFDLLVLLFDRSEFLAEAAIRTPDLIEDQLASGQLLRSRAADELLEDLRRGAGNADPHAWLRRFHQAEQMRIGLRDILGLADPEQYLTELSALADACLTCALETVMRRHRLRTAPFAIIGLGKLGGREIDYGSDLDVLFVAGNTARALPRWQTLAVELTDLLSRRTEHGVVFAVDARLRPDGDKGLLVNTLRAYEAYYRRRAQLWEIQALSRTRAVAGDPELGQRFCALAARWTDFSSLSGMSVGDTSAAGASDAAAGRSVVTGRRSARRVSLPACVTPDWKQRIHAMRLRIERERTPAGKDELAIKTGRGGLMDAEFVAQALVLEHGWAEANTLRALERGRAAGVLPDADRLIDNFRRLRRVEGILRRWSYEGETVLPDDPAPFYRVAVRCGFATPDEFRAALRAWRQTIREVYLKVFAPPPGQAAA